MTSYQIFIYDPDNIRQAILTEFASLDFSRRVNGGGALTLNIADLGQFDPGGSIPITRDWQIILYRQIGARKKYQEGSVFFVNRVEFSGGNEPLVSIRAVDACDLLKRRIVAYNSGTANTDKTDFADDIMKAIVYENLGAGAGAGRIISGLTVAADLGAGVSMSKAFSRRQVKSVLDEIAKTCWQQGTYLAYDITGTPGALTFQTYTGQRGTDRSSDIVLDKGYGNAADLRLAYDWEKLITTCYAGGQGQGTARTIQTATDSALEAISTYARVEGWQDARQTNMTAAVLAEAREKLQEGRAKISLSGRAVDTDATTYGVDYFFGDIVTATAKGVSVPVRIDTVHLKAEGGNETVDIRFAGELEV